MFAIENINKALRIIVVFPSLTTVIGAVIALFCPRIPNLKVGN